jgi:hypothetical protein
MRMVKPAGLKIVSLMDNNQETKIKRLIKSKGLDCFVQVLNPRTHTVKYPALDLKATEMA